MIGIVAKNQREMFGATLYAGRDDPQGEYFEFWYVEATRFEDRQHVPNLISDVSYTTIATTWDMGFADRQYVEIDGDMYKIDDISIDRNAGRAGVNRLARNPLTEYRLTLNKVANPRAVMRNG
ncbi:MAG: hypothetical protein IJX76_04925 [Clostridia bacterium]|nr:hypothetical protein [Clostridia bacterium]